VPEVREAQADLARAHGLDGFCYYHYWFNGRRLLDRPFAEVLATGAPDFPFCLCWANEDWTRAWDGSTSERLVVQRYSEEDDRAHIRWLLTAARDERYVRVDGRPLFLIYKASLLPEPRRTTDVWREEARRAGVGDLYLCRVESERTEHGDPEPLGFDAAVEFQPEWGSFGRPLRRSLPERLLRRVGIGRRGYRLHEVHDYAATVERMLARPEPPYKRFPCVTPSWDNTARRKSQGFVLDGAAPQLYERWLRAVVDRFEPFGPGEDLVFINAWNEWAEGNHLEPCCRFGREWLDATARALDVRGALEGPADARRQTHRP
jgi:lipopolysaccharide biosynthesis protein